MSKLNKTKTMKLFNLVVISLSLFSMKPVFAHDGDHSDDPFEKMEKMQAEMLQRMNKMFQGDGLNGDLGGGLGDYFNQTEMMGEFQRNIVVNEHEDNNYKYITIDTDGVSKDSLKIDIKNQMIKLSGEIRKTEKVERDGMDSSSTYVSTFSRQFTVPSGVDESGVKIEEEKKTIVIKFPKRKA